MAGGRPTKYNEKVLEQAKYYVDNHQECGDIVPTAVGLAFLLEISDKTLDNWGKEHPEFLQTLQRIQQKQHKELVGGGLSGDFTPTISKLMLHNHGYSDKAVTDNTTKTETTIKVLSEEDKEAVEKLDEV